MFKRILFAEILRRLEGNLLNNFIKFHGAKKIMGNFSEKLLEKYAEILSTYGKKLGKF